MENLVSIIIPARNEKYLNKTIKGLLENAEGPIEVIAVIEGQPYPEEIEGVKYIYHPEAIGMKYSINEGVAISTGKYIMKIDAHCIVAPGFDTILKRDHQPNWIQIPRKHPLVEAEWKPDLSYQIDYEYWIWPPKYPTTSLHGYRWLQRGAEKKDIMIDDTLTFQGSCWFMTREWWNKMDFMNDEGYNQLHAQEAAYIGTATWMAGGRVVTNKNTWYAHLFKSKQMGRGYHIDDTLRRRCYKYSYKHWVEDNKEGFIKLIGKFWPLPGWPNDWRERLWKKK